MLTHRRKILIGFVLLATLSGICLAQSSWTRIKGPYSGDISVIAVDHHGYCYAASPFNGVYLSTDQGMTWPQKNSGLSWSGLSTLFIDSSNTVYAGSFFNGLYKSTNGGTNWSKTSLTAGAQSGILLAGGLLAIGGLDTVSMSTDNGDTWMSSEVSGEIVVINSVANDGLGNIYAGLQRIPPSPNSAAYGGGVFISSDSGKTWQPDGLMKDSIATIVSGSVNDIFVSTGSGIYSSADGNSNWTLNSAGLPPGRIAALSNSASGNVVAAVGDNLYVYDETTRFWGLVSGGVPSITCFYYDPTGISYAGTATDGVFRLTSQKRTWVQCGVIPASTTAVGFDKDGNLYVGTTQGVYAPSPETGTWYDISGSLSGAQVYGIDTVSFIRGIFAATSGGLFYSDDGGATWLTRNGIWTYNLAESSENLYAATTSGVLSSTNEGSNWEFDSNIGFPIPVVFSLLGLGDRVFAGTESNGVFVTTDGGYFWSETGLSSPLMFHSVTTLAAALTEAVLNASNSATADTTIYAGTGSSGVYFTTDSGNDWTHVDGITATDISAFFFTKNSVFVGTHDGGVFVSTDNGQDWETMNSGLSTMGVSSLGMDRQGLLYAATDSGLFKTAGPVTALASPYRHTPETFSLSQNYPNPFNPTTAISYELSAASEVSLKVYDILGREVATVVNGKQSAGRYSVMFDGSRLPSGVYFYRLVAGSHVITRKMVLIR